MISLMTDSKATGTQSRLTLNSRLADLTMICPWVDALAKEHQIPSDTVFAINLCLEEALSNVIRHGYAGEPGQSLTVEFIASEMGGPSFVIEDHAQPFNPLEAPHVALATTIDHAEQGGRGIRLLRRFAGSLAWEPLPHGNRLTIGFDLAPKHSQPAS